MYKVKYTDNTGNNDSIQEYSTKEKAMEAIDSELDEVREYFVPCPHCGEMQRLDFHQIKFCEDQEETTIMENQGIKQRYGIMMEVSMHVGKSQNNEIHVCWEGEVIMIYQRYKKQMYLL